MAVWEASGGSQGIGANLGQVVTEELNKSKEKELQLEVSSSRSFSEPDYQYIVKILKLECHVLTLHKGGSCLLERLYSAGLAVMKKGIANTTAGTHTQGFIRYQPGQG